MVILYVIKMSSLNDTLYSLVDALSNTTNCMKRRVGTIIYNKITDEVVGRGFNWHENGVCDCSSESTSKHAEIAAIDDIDTKHNRSDLVAYVNRRPCENCHKALMRHVKEIRYTHES